MNQKSLVNIGNKLLEFYINLNIKVKLPEKVQVMNPFFRDEIVNLNKLFYDKFFNDFNKRVLLLGINPGRFGAGTTGIPFTDPVKLQEQLRIMNNLDKKRELSSDFIYEVIDGFGGPKQFYGKFLLSAICPLGLLKNGKNINYYDLPNLTKVLKPFIVKSLKEQIEIVNENSVAICIGQGKNISFLKELNNELKLFKSIKVLPHPRWIMQYRLKQKSGYLESYLTELKKYS